MSIIYVLKLLNRDITVRRRSGEGFEPPNSPPHPHPPPPHPPPHRCLRQRRDAEGPRFSRVRHGNRVVFTAICRVRPGAACPPDRRARLVRLERSLNASAGNGPTAAGLCGPWHTSLCYPGSRPLPDRRET